MTSTANKKTKNDKNSELLQDLASQGGHFYFLERNIIIKNIIKRKRKFKPETMTAIMFVDHYKGTGQIPKYEIEIYISTPNKEEVELLLETNIRLDDFVNFNEIIKTAHEKKYQLKIF